MPYASRRQARWAHATRQPFARRWDKETPDFAALPEKKDAGAEAGPPLRGPGGLLSAPGMGRKWGKRKIAVTTKPMTRSEAARAAALARWGKYTPKPKPQPTGRRGRKPAKTEAERQAAQQQRRTEREQERQAQHTQNRADVFRKMNIAPDGQAALEALRRGEQPDPAAIARGGFVDAGLVEQAADGSYRMTSAGRALMSSAESGDTGRAGDTISSSRDRLGQRRARQAEQAKRRQERAAKPAGGGGSKKKKEPPKSDRRATERTRRTQKRLSDALGRARGRIGQRPAQTAKSFTVFKDHTGAHRWLARSTTAYRDRDGEIITTKALEADAARMTATGQYGPLRWWHCGVPNPFDPVAPWGPGIDIGDCDFSIVIGRTSIESGTFKSAAIAEVFAESADEYELSPGFFHPPDQPNAAGEYDTIRRFERSPVPVKYGRASNLFTGLTVKEARMDPQVYEQRVKAFIAEMQAKGAPPEAVAATLVNMERADKSAQAQGVAFKSDDAPQVEQTIYYGPGNQPGIIQDGAWVALKAAMPMEMAVEETASEEEEAPERAFLGDMDPAEYMEQMKAMLAPALKMSEMLKGFSDGMAELKSMLGGGVATKDAATLSRIAVLEQELARLKGDQPALAVPSEIEAALKSQGPQAPPDPSQPQLPADATPLQQAAARLMPQLYGVTPTGQFNGWQAMQPLPPQQS